MKSRINPEDKRAAPVLRALKERLTSLRTNPGSAPASYAALAREIGVDAATLWRHRKSSKAVNDYCETIVRAGKAGKLPRRPARSPSEMPAHHSGRPSTLPTYDPETLKRGFQIELDEVRWPLQRFLAKSRRFRDPSDLPRALFELERCVADLNTSLRTLSALSQSWEDAERLRFPLVVESG